MKNKILYFITFLLAINANATPIYFNQHHQPIKVKSWKEMRDQNIVKQDLDYSCGAASIATLLNGYFQQNVSEEDVLRLMDTGDMMASFEDMQRALGELGYEAKGYAVSFETLQTLKIPVIVYVKHHKTDHFNVVSGINSQFIRLADPSLGKTTLSKHQFLEMWNTRDDETFTGKILVILPKNDSQVQDDQKSAFFTKQVKQPSVQSLRFLSSQ